MGVLSDSLTVSRVSGLIALGNSVVIFTLPLLLAILLICHYDRTRSAASWSVLARQVHSSAWPSILRTDSVASQHVHWSITTVAWLNIILVFLGVVSGVITPLGLGDEIEAASSQNVEFQYAPDSSSFGNGTMVRPDMPMSRDCYIETDFCPGAIVPGAVIDRNTADPRPGRDKTATTGIPGNITEIFRSATGGSTVLSTLDIQYRSWMSYRNEFFNDNEPYVKGRFKHIDMLLSQEQYVLAEGIIADTMSGGIGWRNHTVPADLQYGGEWEEDVLWVEPDITCVDTNLSIEVVLDEPLMERAEYRSLRLIDRGGFADLPRENPYDGFPNLTYSAPDVYERANRTAWLSNLLTAMALNLTDARDWRYGMNVSVGEHYNISMNDSSLGITPQLGVNTMYLSSLWFTDSLAASFGPNGSLTALGGTVLEPKEDYPYEMAVALFEEVAGRCSGQYNEASLANDFNVECGYLLGAGHRIDGGEPLMEEVGSVWEQPLYTCASAVKASIKAVTFVMNGSLVLENLVVKRAEDKAYESSEYEPLWAFEDWWHPGSEGAQAAPLWGLVDSSSEDTPGYNFTRSAAFYLPGTEATKNLVDPEDMLAASVAPSAALRALFGGSSGFSVSNRGAFPAYSGEHGFSLMNKWRRLSENAEGAAKVLKLVWTDMIASATVGTTPPSPQRKRSFPSADQRTVAVYSRRITYDIRYAVPAILLLVLWVSLILSGFVVGVLNRHPFRKLKVLLNDTSVGRYAAANVGPSHKGLMRAKSSRWLDGAGYVPLKLGGEQFPADGEPYQGGKDSEQGDKGNNTQFVRPLMRNDSLENVGHAGGRMGEGTNQ